MKTKKLSFEDFRKEQLPSTQKATISGGWPAPAPGSDPTTIGPPPVKPLPGDDGIPNDDDIETAWM